MNGFETLPIKDLPTTRSGNHVLSPMTIAFGELPPELAMLVPISNRTYESVRSGALDNLHKRYPDRIIHTRKDEEKEGIWVWWIEGKTNA